MAMIHEITKLVGKHKARKRIGRGPGSGAGKTAGRGHKGAGSRAGFTGSINALYEGGQTPYFRRIPKRGFSNVRFRTNYNIVNLRALEQRFADGDTVDRESLLKVGLLRHKDDPIKILGEGELTKKLTVTVEKFSGSAKKKIEAAGGSVTALQPSDENGKTTKAAKEKPSRKSAKDKAKAEVKTEPEKKTKAKAEAVAEEQQPEAEAMAPAEEEPKAGEKDETNTPAETEEKSDDAG